MIHSLIWINIINLTNINFIYPTEDTVTNEGNKLNYYCNQLSSILIHFNNLHFIFLCWSPHCKGFILPQQHQQRIWHTQSLQNIQLSPLSSPSTSLTADDFATFFTNKTRSISSQFSAPHTKELKPTTSTDKTPLFSSSRRPKYPNLSSPATLQHVL